MLKRIAKYICIEMSKIPYDPDGDLDKIPKGKPENERIYDDDCNEVTLDERLNEFKTLMTANIDFTSRSIESLRKKLDAMCLIVDALNEKKTDEINFMDLVKELTYKINAYEKYEGYKKFPPGECHFNAFNELNSFKCETQEQGSSESN